MALVRWGSKAGEELEPFRIIVPHHGAVSEELRGLRLLSAGTDDVLCDTCPGH